MKPRKRLNVRFNEPLAKVPGHVIVTNDEFQTPIALVPYPVGHRTRNAADVDSRALMFAASPRMLDALEFVVESKGSESAIVCAQEAIADALGTRTIAEPDVWYAGVRTPGGDTSDACAVSVNTDVRCSPLAATELGIKKSPTGFNWGYGGSGPASLAHAILAHALNVSVANILYQRYKTEVIARLPQSENWRIDRADVVAWVSSINDELTRLPGRVERIDSALEMIYGQTSKPNTPEDLLADLMHWCDNNRVSFDDVLERASNHYHEETTLNPK